MARRYFDFLADAYNTGCKILKQTAKSVCSFPTQKTCGLVLVQAKFPEIILIVIDHGHEYFHSVCSGSQVHAANHLC